MSETRPAPKRRKGSMGQTIGGIIVGFEQQILRSTPPAAEMVRHARPDAVVPAADGSRLVIGLPDRDADPHPAGPDDHQGAPGEEPA